MDAWRTNGCTCNEVSVACKTTNCRAYTFYVTGAWKTITQVLTCTCITVLMLLIDHHWHPHWLSWVMFTAMTRPTITTRKGTTNDEACGACMMGREEV